jgi:signal transduction histidine kinase
VRLSEFLLSNQERILQRWEDFARTLPRGRNMSIAALRNDAARMLEFVAADLETSQSPQQQFNKSIGLGRQPPGGERSPANDHGIERALHRFSIGEIVSEYRALRASVTQLWLDESPATYESVIELVRFNEAVDQILAEAVVCFSEKMDADADLFTASVGHDLRTPLSAVVNSAEVLKHSTTLSAAERAVAMRIQQSALRIAAMLRQLNDFTRVRLGGVVGYQRESSNVGELCRASIDEIQASHPGRQISFMQSGDTTANVDRVRIAQLISNLIANAIQHGSVGGNVAVQVAGEDKHVCVEVHNEGPAIDPAQLSLIFEPMSRGRKSGNEPGSLGLGLYIARTIAYAHGGTIEVSSTDSDGTTFVVQLPRTGEAARQTATQPDD